MKVYALSGPSGTGKSTSALAFAHQHHIEAIIDDGLFIVGGIRRAGKSAKFEKNVITAVRTAIFDDDTHRQEVILAIKEATIHSLLIIGTSVKMVNKIAAQLELGKIHHYFTIGEVRSKQEIQMARYIRQTTGQHVMPIPYEQVEQNFFKRLIQKGKSIFANNRIKVGENTVVQPDFHYEIVTVHKQVYRDVITYALRTHPFIARAENIQFDLTTMPKISATIEVWLDLETDMRQQLVNVQQVVSDAFERTFAVAPTTIRLFVKNAQKKETI